MLVTFLRLSVDFVRVLFFFYLFFFCQIRASNERINALRVIWPYHKKYALYNITPRPPRNRVPENIRKPRPAGHRSPHHRANTYSATRRLPARRIQPVRASVRLQVSSGAVGRCRVCTAWAALKFYIILVQWTNNTLRRPCGRHFAAISCAVWYCVCALRKHRSRLVRIYFIVSRNNIVQRLHLYARRITV